MTGGAGLDKGGSRRNGEKWLHSECILNVALKGFADELDVKV